MAKNVVQRTSAQNVTRRLAVASGITSGELDLISKMVVFALDDRDAAGEATVEVLGAHKVITLTAVAVENGTVVSAIAIGNRLYLDSGVVNKDNTDGTFIGYALGTVASQGTAAIPVALVGGS